PSAGHPADEPVHVSATSHGPATGRHVTPVALNVHVALQHDPAVPLAAPSSQVSQPSIVPFPHRTDPDWQPAAPAQTSAPLHGLPSSQRAFPPSSIRPLQLSSTPLQASGPDLFTVTAAVALTWVVFVA